MAKFAPCLKFVPIESKYAFKYGNLRASPAMNHKAQKKHKELQYLYKENMDDLLMKSKIKRPLQALPEALPKKVSPLGRVISLMAAERPPVSELESPKLKIARQLHFFEP